MVFRVIKYFSDSYANTYSKLSVKLDLKHDRHIWYIAYISNYRLPCISN